MFEAIQYRWFVSKIAAEIKAQVKSQSLANDFLSNHSAIAAVQRVKTDKEYNYVAGPRMLPFMAACEVLAAVMDDRGCAENMRLLAREFLRNRIARAESLNSPLIDTLMNRVDSFAL
jgi:hypothetical protein